MLSKEKQIESINQLIEYPEAIKIAMKGQKFQPYSQLRYYPIPPNGVDSFTADAGGTEVSILIPPSHAKPDKCKLTFELELPPAGLPPATDEVKNKYKPYVNILYNDHCPTFASGQVITSDGQIIYSASNLVAASSSMSGYLLNSKKRRREDWFMHTGSRTSLAPNQFQVLHASAVDNGNVFEPVSTDSFDGVNNFTYNPPGPLSAFIYNNGSLNCRDGNDKTVFAGAMDDPSYITINHNYCVGGNRPDYFYVSLWLKDIMPASFWELPTTEKISNYLLVKLVFSSAKNWGFRVSEKYDRSNVTTNAAPAGIPAGIRHDLVAELNNGVKVSGIRLQLAQENNPEIKQMIDAQSKTQRTVMIPFLQQQQNSYSLTPGSTNNVTTRFSFNQANAFLLASFFQIVEPKGERQVYNGYDKNNRLHQSPNGVLYRTKFDMIDTHIVNSDILVQGLDGCKYDFETLACTMWKYSKLNGANNISFGEVCSAFAYKYASDDYSLKKIIKEQIYKGIPFGNTNGIIDLIWNVVNSKIRQAGRSSDCTLNVSIIALLPLYLLDGRMSLSPIV